MCENAILRLVSDVELTSDEFANVHQNEIERKTQLETNRDIQNRLEVSHFF